METRDKTERKAWIKLLAGADPARLKAFRDQLPDSVRYAYIVRPETGMLMVQAKADGSQNRFNLGEVTISRCVLEVNEKYLGGAWVMGGDLNHAELAAMFDGLLQDPEHHESLMNGLIRVLEQDYENEIRSMENDARDTTVEFFTMKRGE
ncbi:MAG: phosphonate C-P lyase system protein PhnG [Desulfobacteraceae bacterium]|nr:MAG: phosphonate C-P lyase system protein PhnG [Desulfobacteraceae bacterium]